MKEYLLTGLFFLDYIAIVLFIYSIVEFIQVRIQQKKETKRLKEHRKAQRQFKRLKAKIYQSQIEEILKETTINVKNQ